MDRKERQERESGECTGCWRGYTGETAATEDHQTNLLNNSQCHLHSLTWKSNNDNLLSDKPQRSQAIERLLFPFSLSPSYLFPSYLSILLPFITSFHLSNHHIHLIPTFLSFSTHSVSEIKLLSQLSVSEIILPQFPSSFHSHTQSLISLFHIPAIYYRHISLSIYLSVCHIPNRKFLFFRLPFSSQMIFPSICGLSLLLSLLINAYRPIYLDLFLFPSAMIHHYIFLYIYFCLYSSGSVCLSLPSFTSPHHDIPFTTTFNTSSLSDIASTWLLFYQVNLWSISLRRGQAQLPPSTRKLLHHKMEYFRSQNRMGDT